MEFGNRFFIFFKIKGFFRYWYRILGDFWFDKEFCNRNIIDIIMSDLVILS